MSIKELLTNVGQYLSDYLAKHFTGRFIFTVHVKDGGIGRVNVEIKHDLPRILPGNMRAANKGGNNKNKK